MTMALYRSNLPQLSGREFLTDGGLETTLVFHNGIELPCFAAFPLVMSREGRDTLRSYFHPYLELAKARQLGFVLDTATWRANADWGAKLGYSSSDLNEVRHAAVAFAQELRWDYATSLTPVVINGVLGSRGDGYRADDRMSAEEARTYHAAEIEDYRDSGADMVSAITMTYPEEAIGIVRVAQDSQMPVVISFTLETDGRLPSGDTLQEAILQVDAATGSGPTYYMINCAHPTHFADVLSPRSGWLDRIRGLRANASTLSHAELDAATELDAGDPADLGQRYRSLRERLPKLSIIGGCCGTDHRHIAAICEACAIDETASMPWTARRMNEFRNGRRAAS
jgi:S-methylmethionine-dependent homocysteine/selenocysteine methylase